MTRVSTVQNLPEFLWTIINLSFVSRSRFTVLILTVFIFMTLLYFHWFIHRDSVRRNDFNGICLKHSWYDGKYSVAVFKFWLLNLFTKLQRGLFGSCLWNKDIISLFMGLKVWIRIRWIELCMNVFIIYKYCYLRGRKTYLTFLAWNVEWWHYWHHNICTEIECTFIVLHVIG